MDGADAFAVWSADSSVAAHATKAERGRGPGNPEPGAARTASLTAHDTRLVSDEDLSAESRRRYFGPSELVPRAGTERARDRQHRPRCSEAALLLQIAAR